MVDKAETSVGKQKVKRNGSIFRDFTSAIKPGSQRN
jgi:hypothetical protein